MAKIARLNVMITANSKGLTVGVSAAVKWLDRLTARARAMTAQIGRSFSNLTSRAVGGLKNFASNIGTRVTNTLRNMAVAATAAAVGFAYFVKVTSEGIDANAKFARRVGVSYDQLKALQYAAGLAGIESEALNKSLERMSDTLGAAFKGESGAVEAFEKIGLSVERLQMMRPEQRFEAISQAISRIPDPSERINAARDIFGKQGGALLELFGGGASAIADATEKIQTFGLALSELETSGIEYALDRFSDIQSVIEGIGTQISAKVAPYTAQIADDFLAWVDNAGGVETIVDTGLSKLGSVLDTIAEKTRWVTAVWEELKDVIGSVAAVWDMLPEWLKKTVTFNPVRDMFVSDIQGKKEQLDSEAGKSPSLTRRIENFNSRAQYNALERQRETDREQFRGGVQNSQFQQSQANMQAEQQRAAQIMQGARDRGFVPSRPAVQPGPYAAMLDELRGIRQNTGKNNVAYAG